MCLFFMVKWVDPRRGYVSTWMGELYIMSPRWQHGNWVDCSIGESRIGEISGATTWNEVARGETTPWVATHSRIMVLLLLLSGHSTIGCMNLLGWAKEGSVTLTHPPWIRDTQLDLQLGRLHARLPSKVTSNPSLDDILRKKRRLSRCAQQSWCWRIIFSN